MKKQVIVKSISFGSLPYDVRMQILRNSFAYWMQRDCGLTLA